MRYTVIVADPVTGVARAVLAGKPVPAWAKDLVHEDDLVDADELAVEDDAEDQAPAPEAPGLEVPEGDLGDLLAWIGAADEYADRKERGDALYGKAIAEGASAEDLEELGMLIMAAVYRTSIPAPEAPAAGADGSPNQPVAPEPPRAGPGSGVEAWSAYAKDLGIEVPADAKRDDVIELVDKHRALAQG